MIVWGIVVTTICGLILAAICVAIAEAWKKRKK